MGKLHTNLLKNTDVTGGRKALASAAETTRKQKKCDSVPKPAVPKEIKQPAS